MKYENYNDYELVSYVSENSEEACNIIFDKYKPLIVDRANYLCKYGKKFGLEINDLIQEGMVGLNDAIKNFSESRDTTFYTYAAKCINSRMISCIVKFSRFKHKILNDSILLELYDEDKSNGFGKSLIDNSYNPEEVLIDAEDERELMDIIDKCLSENEKQVVNLKISGFKYKEIADILGHDMKYVDNCMRRVRNKLKVHLKNI